MLSNAGLVEVHPAAQQRIYKLRPQPLQEIDIWLEPYRRFWNESFDRLADYLEGLQKEEEKKNEQKD